MTWTPTMASTVCLFQDAVLDLSQHHREESSISLVAQIQCQYRVELVVVVTIEIGHLIEYF